MGYAFASCSNMVGNYIDTPNTSNSGSFANMFNTCSKFNSPVNFDTSSAITMKLMFNGCTVFNQSVLSFKTSNVIDMSYV